MRIGNILNVGLLQASHKWTLENGLFEYRESENTFTITQAEEIYVKVNGIGFRA